MNRTLWITGVSGFSGRHLVQHLVVHPARPRIVGIDIRGSTPGGLDQYCELDVRSASDVALLARSNPPDWVIHLAGAMPPADDARMWQVNVGGTMGLLSGLASAGSCNCVRVVSIGSAAEYAVPFRAEPICETAPCGGLSPYGLTKWAQSLLAMSVGRETGVAVMVARTFNLLGPGLSSQLVAGALCEQFAQGSSEVLVGNRESARDYIDVRDAVAAYWLLALRGSPGEVYNVCSGTATTVGEILAVLQEISGLQPRVRMDPTRLRQNDPAVVCGSNHKLRSATGWNAQLSIRRSLADMLLAPHGAQSQQAGAERRIPQRSSGQAGGNRER